MAASGSSTPRVTFLTPEKPEKAEEHVKPKKLGKLTVKYNRKEIQRRLNLEEWVDAKLQELYQSKDVPRDKQVQADIDIDDLLDLSVEDQKRKLQAILKECARPTGEFTAELVQRLKGLRKISALRRK
ncbi:protein phosphatase 1 regulatory subunit 14B-like [Xenopus laevis]|uniref:Protein phosphatase 1 regulatory subunit 14B-like n=1 Tax=Xenopus laevis TaxID=8355 RepID=A0A8J1LN20_XENLA|nr:protein phosphatase 1 regulatory subunit 14B-like [Xenopus laevis]